MMRREKKKRTTPASKKKYPTEKVRLKKKGVPTGKDGRARKKRRKAVTKTLKTLQGGSIRNTATGKSVRIVKGSIKETAHHAQGDTLSTIAAMDARRQIRDAKPVRTAKPKNNKRQKEMNIVEMTVMKGKLLTTETKVLTGKTTDGSELLYSITAKKKCHKK